MLASKQPGELFEGTALWEPPYVDFGNTPADATMISERIPAVVVGSFLILLDQTPMLDVAKRFDLEMGQTGDASESLRWICLTGADADGRWGLWIDSGEINGDSVGGFRMIRIDAARKVDMRCRITSMAITNPAGLRLGMTPAQLQQTLSAPSAVMGETSLYVFGGSGADGSTIDSVIAVAFSNGTVERFAVSKSQVF
jgi:hypothetical protein